MSNPFLYTFASHAFAAGARVASTENVQAAAALLTLEWRAACGGCGALAWDAHALEQLALSAPTLFERLRAAVQAGEFELLGAAYAQPVGLLHGGESNLRQLLLGVRTLRRLFGRAPTCAWQHAFPFFPQAPQLLVAAGFESVALAPTWSARTPSLPLETAPLVAWEGHDGTRLAALAPTLQAVQEFAAELDVALGSAAEGALVLHTFDALGAARGEHDLRAALAQWRARLASPSLSPSQAIEVLRGGAGSAPVRRYQLDETFHGLTLGKNGDYLPRFSRSAEEQLLAAESVSALAGMFGRPYASPDVYPAWELEQAWRDVCVGQHHHLHEREGEVGAFGERAFERGVATASEVFQRTLDLLGERVDALEGSTLVYNPLGWTRDVQHEGGVVRSVPAYGYKVVDPYDGVEEPRLGRIQMELGDEELVLRRGAFEARIDRRRGVVTQLFSRDFPEGALAKGRPLGQLEMRRQRSLERFDSAHLSTESSENNEFAEFAFVREGRGGSRLRIVYSMSTLHDALWIRIQGENLARPDAGVLAALQMPFAAHFKPDALLRDHPYGVSEAQPSKRFVRRYPGERGDPGAAPFEEALEGGFTAQSFVDLVAPGAARRGLLVVNDGSQGWLRDAHGVRAVLNAYDPWDGEHFDNVFDAEFWIFPHGALTHTERMRLSMECNLGSPRFEPSVSVLGGGDLPPALGALNLDAPNVLVTALHRASPVDFEGASGAFGEGVRDPFVIRLVEFDGKPAEALLRLPGPIAKAAKTDALGRVVTPLAPRMSAPPFGPQQLPWSALVVPLRPHEVATVMVDLEFGRHVAALADPALASAWSARRRALER